MPKIRSMFSTMQPLRRSMTGCAAAAACVALAALAPAMSHAGAATAHTPILPSPFSDSRLSARGGVVPVAGDFDCDGRSDVFWYGSGAAPDEVWYGGASATKLGHTRLQFVVNGRYRPFAGDFNGDGCADIVWIPTTVGLSYVWLGRHDRTFSSVEASGTYALSKFAGSRNTVSVGDFNGDGSDDLFLSSPLGGGTTILEGSSDPHQLFAAIDRPPELYGKYMPIAADFNGDGRTDIYWSSLDKAHSSLWVNHAGMKFTSWPVDSLPSTSFAGDFNDDHNADLFEYAPGPFAERIWYGRASSNFPLSFDVTATPNILGSYSPVVGDYNGNGKADVIWYTHNGAPSPYWIAR